MSTTATSEMNKEGTRSGEREVIDLICFLMIANGELLQFVFLPSAF